ncbi:MAG: 50S ribosomal protein L11 methyltransferase [Planctomycetes bacterium]|nr:50S ribosomal protein L11 methyltransferase [Planctomycetota bacterium]
MKWFRIQVTAPSSQAEDAAAAMAVLGCSGVKIDEGEPTRLEAHFDKDVATGVAAVVAPWGGKISSATWVEEEDWTQAWKRKAPAIVVGKFCIHPSHEPPRPGLINLLIDAGMAFGSGDHATTRLMLLEMQQMAQVRPLGRVLDLGCGSGVLAMAAVKLGATEVVASDIDRRAIEEAQNNVKTNRVGKITFIEGSLGKCPGNFDTIVANVTTEVHLKRSGDYALRLNPGGRLRAGGVRAEESESVAQVMEAVITRASEGWTLLKLKSEINGSSVPAVAPVEMPAATAKASTARFPKPAPPTVKPASTPGTKRSEDPPTLLPHQLSAPAAAAVASVPAPPPARVPDRRRGAFHHLDMNVSNLEQSRNFYLRLLPRFGFELGESGDGWMSFTHGDFHLTLVQVEEKWKTREFHRKGVGVNHLAFSAASRDAVDALHEWLVWEGITVLYGGPMEMGGMEAPNYGVFFEDPDRMKLEYVYRP